MMHPQSGKEVDSIVICGVEFIYSDKNGYQRFRLAPIDFAKKIIKTFPAKISSTGKIVYMENRLISKTVLLKWHRLSDNTIELAIHDCGHVWSSEPITIEY